MAEVSISVSRSGRNFTPHNLVLTFGRRERAEPHLQSCPVGSLTKANWRITSLSSGDLWLFVKRPYFLSFNKRKKHKVLKARAIGSSNNNGNKTVRVPTPTPSESDKNLRTVDKNEVVAQFKMSDFDVCSHVSIGLAGRRDEVVFEAIVRNSESPLKNSRVVLRQLAGSHAQRRGRRALEVLRNLARRQFMYQSYATRIHGYIPSSDGKECTFTLVHGYYGSYSLHQWLLLTDWLPVLEAKLTLDEDCARRVGDDTTGGPTVSRQLRLTRMLMRDLLIGVNYLHSHGLAHTELRLENVHISCVDRHIKVGILGNAADFHDNSSKYRALDGIIERRKHMIAYDVRCVGFMMAKMVLRELMDPSIFMKFKTFLTMGNNPSSLREFLLPIIYKRSPEGTIGIQILDRDWGAGWNLLSLMLATKPSDRISCLDALRHPFLCGPRWRVETSIGMIRWGLGSTAVRIAEEYIYGVHQRNRLAHFIDLMERLNPNTELKKWHSLLSGKWRLLYHTGRQIGLTLRQVNYMSTFYFKYHKQLIYLLSYNAVAFSLQAFPRVLIGDVYLSFFPTEDNYNSFSMEADISFTAIVNKHWPHDKSGKKGNLHISSNVEVVKGERIYQIESKIPENQGIAQEKQTEENEKSFEVSQGQTRRKTSIAGRWMKVNKFLPKETPSSLPVVRLSSSDIDITMNLNDASMDTSLPNNILHEVRLQIPQEMFEISKLVCGTYIDSRLLILRGVAGSALLFTRSFGS